MANSSRASTSTVSTAPELLRLAGDDVPVLAGLAEVDGEGDDLGPVALLDPLQHHAGVQAARVEQQHAADLGGSAWYEAIGCGIPRRAIERGKCGVFVQAAAARIPAVQRAMRILSIMLITAGLVVLTDAGLTLVWQEPLSAAYGSLKQGQAADQLNDLESQYPSACRPGGDRRRPAATRRRRGSSPTASSPTCRRATRSGGSRSTASASTSSSSRAPTPPRCRRAPATTRTPRCPGQPGTVAIAGHRTTYLAPFRHIDQIEDGDEIRIEMPYAAFTYTVQRHEIVDPATSGSSSRSATISWC